MKGLVYRHVFGWTVHPTATLGFSLIKGRDVVIEEGAHVGHFNVFRNVHVMHLGKDAYIKNFNTFSGPGNDLPGERSLRLGEGAHVMSHHYFDLSGSVEIGREAIVGGRDTQFWTHSRFRSPSGELSLESRALVLGDGVYVGARATLVHCGIPDGCVVGAGAVVTGTFDGPDWFIAGNPARPIKSLGADTERPND